MEKELLAEEFARNLLSWKNSGFSIENSVRLTDAKSKESLAEYIARPPLSLKKIRYEPLKLPFRKTPASSLSMTARRSPWTHGRGHGRDCSRDRLSSVVY